MEVVVGANGVVGNGDAIIAELKKRVHSPSTLSDFERILCPRHGSVESVLTALRLKLDGTSSAELVGQA